MSRPLKRHPDSSASFAQPRKYQKLKLAMPQIRRPIDTILAETKGIRDLDKLERPVKRPKRKRKKQARPTSWVDPDQTDLTFGTWFNAPTELPILELDMNDWPGQRAHILREIDRMRLKILTLKEIVGEMDWAFEMTEE